MTLRRKRRESAVYHGKVRALEVDLAAHASMLRLVAHQRDECMAALRAERRRNAELRAQLASWLDVRAGGAR